MKTILLRGCVAAVAICAVAAAGGETLKEAYAAHFQVGVAVNRSMVLGVAGSANGAPRSVDQVRADAAVAAEQYNAVVSENDMKWGMIHPREGAGGFDFTAADAFVAFGERHGMAVVGHTLVWHEQTPEWVFKGKDGQRATREELLARMREHIRTVVGRYKGKVKVWDVVNEAISDRPNETLRPTPWLEIIGPDFIAKAFEYAHEADPDAVLRYNDYGLENPAKRGKALALVKGLLEAKVPVMAIGTQTHVGITRPSAAEMDATLTDLESLGLPVHITELDVNGAEAGQQTMAADVSSNAAATEGGLVAEADRRMAEQYADLFRVFLKHEKSVKMVTFWGVNDAVSWRAKGRPLLFDGDNRKKPAYEAVMGVARGR